MTKKLTLGLILSVVLLGSLAVLINKRFKQKNDIDLGSSSPIKMFQDDSDDESQTMPSTTPVATTGSDLSQDLDQLTNELDAITTELEDELAEPAVELDF